MLNFVARAMQAVAWRLRCQWAAWRARATSDAALAAGPAKRILVLCYGNIYRSPYAAALLRQRLGVNFDVRSGGFHAAGGRASPPGLIQLAAGRGLDLASHRSTRVHTDEIARADLVVVMDRHNWQAVQSAGGARRIAWLGAMDGGGEIRDPYGRDEGAIRSEMERLHRCTERLAERIIGHFDSPPA